MENNDKGRVCKKKYQNYRIIGKHYIFKPTFILFYRLENIFKINWRFLFLELLTLSAESSPVFRVWLLLLTN